MRTVVILLSVVLSTLVFACTVRLCEHDHKRGKCCSKGLGFYDVRTLRGSCPRNNAVSSVRIYGACSILLYKKSRFRGRAYTLNGPGYWNSRQIPNDAVSSFKIMNLCTVTLCEHDHKRGKCCSKGLGSYDVGTLRGSCPRNNAVSSVRIKGGCSVRLYTKSRFRGRAHTLNGPGYWNSRSIPNDAVSSFKIIN